MTHFEQTLQDQLDEIRKSDLARALRRVDSAQGTQITVAGRELLNFSSNDYLGLANHHRLKEAAARAAMDFGAGAGASRLICGSLSIHHQLEESLAVFKGSEAALGFATGYAAAMGAIGALLRPGDLIIADRLVHACCIDAARLCGATLRVFGHNDPNDLATILKRADGQPPSTSQSGSGERSRRILIVTESVFSMDGDLAPLREIVELKEKHGAWLMLDEAHATGLFGENRRGLAEACELFGRVEIQMGTLGKALGAAGGYICGSRRLIDLLINRARTFIFSTAPAPAVAAAALAGIQVVQSGEGEILRQRLWQRVDEVKNAVINAGWKIGPVQSPIIPLIVGDERRAVDAARSLGHRGIFIPAVRYPAVPRGEARLRLTVSAAHSRDQVGALEKALRDLQHTV
jgi:8-amino-7-oxononanoate synthase